MTLQIFIFFIWKSTSNCIFNIIFLIFKLFTVKQSLIIPYFSTDNWSNTKINNC